MGCGAIVRGTTLRRYRVRNFIRAAQLVVMVEVGHSPAGGARSARTTQGSTISSSASRVVAQARYSAVFSQE